MVEGLTQVVINDATSPSTDETLVFIEQVESQITDRALGSHTATNQYVDVPPYGKAGGSYDWKYNVRTGRLDWDLGEGVIVPLAGMKAPIISITSCAKNDEAADDTPSWDTLTEWDGSTDDTDYMLLKSGLRDLGYALWFYQNYPYTGPKRLRITYSYGWNVDSDILADWATYKVAIRVLQARLNTNNPDGMAAYDGGDLGVFVPRHYKDLIAHYWASIRYIERTHFPGRHEASLEVI